MGYKLTKKQIKKEVLKCGKDPNYFIKNYVRILHPKKGLIRFETYDFQEDLITTYGNQRFVIILKARQLGISTITAAYILWLMLFTRGKTILVVATQFSVASNLVQKIRDMFVNLPSFLKIAKIQKNNTKEFILDNGSKCLPSSKNQNAGRSHAASVVVVDEAAHIENFEEIWKALYSTLSEGGSCIALSCVTKDTYVYTDKGLKKVGEFIVRDGIGDDIIPEYTILGKDKLRTSNLFHHNGKVDTKIIKTPYTTLECSNNHKLWSFDENLNTKWKKAEEFKVGDFIPLQIGMEQWGNNDDVSDFVPSNTLNTKNVFKPKKITPDLAYFFGIFLAEGHAYKVLNKKTKNLLGGSVTVTCGDDLSHLDETIKFKSHKREIQYSWSSKNLIEFLEYLGFDLSKKAKEKTIPPRLLQMSRKNIVAMLQGIFDGDGWSRSDRGVCGIGLTSKEFVDQISYLLMNFGIIGCRYISEIPPTKKVRVSSTSYRLEINSYNSEIFYNKIGFRFKRKQIKKQFLAKTKFDRSHIIPNSPIWRELFNACSFGSHVLRYTHGVRTDFLFDQSKNIQQKKLLDLFELAKENLTKEQIDKFEKILSPNIRWVQIKDIKSSQNDTYDFSLPEKEDDFWCHSVIYNGLLGHQSPKGAFGWFYDTYTKAKNNENNFYSVELPWHVHPNHDQEWYENEIRNMNGPRHVAQELECKFLASGDTFIVSDIIDRISNEEICEPMFKSGANRNMWFWENAMSDKGYLISADVARGDGRDFSTFYVINLDDCSVAAEFKGKLKIDMFANLLYRTGKEFNDALLVVENNNIGYSVLEKLIEMKYPNLYWSKKGSNEYIEPIIAENMTNSRAGISTQQASRVQMMTKLEEYIRHNIIDIRSDRLLKELNSFVWVNGKPQASGNHNDDLVMAFAIACWVRDTAVVQFSRNKTLNRTMLNNIKIMDSKGDFSFRTNSLRNIARKRNEQIRQKKKEMGKFAWIYTG